MLPGLRQLCLFFIRKSARLFWVVDTEGQTRFQQIEGQEANRYGCKKIHVEGFGLARAQCRQEGGVSRVMTGGRWENGLRSDRKVGLICKIFTLHYSCHFMCLSPV